MNKPRTIVCGDIHGNYRGLLQCLERSKFDYDKDILIQLGDVADGWSEVSECVSELIKINNLISIRGNHDVWMYDWMMFGRTPMLWTQQGGKATMASYVRTGKLHEIGSGHKSFWLNQRDWYIDEKNRLFIHAGWDYMEYGDFNRQASLPVNAGTIAKECHWDRSIIQGAASAFRRHGNTEGKFKALEQFTEVYIGHTAMNEGPIQLGNLWNMDSGSGWNGCLSFMDIDTKEIWKSDNVLTLYPDEKGRG